MTKRGKPGAEKSPTLYERSQGFLILHSTIDSLVLHPAFEQLGTTVARVGKMVEDGIMLLIMISGARANSYMLPAENTPTSPFFM
jgi:hypothetical protein